MGGATSEREFMTSLVDEFEKLEEERDYLVNKVKELTKLVKEREWVEPNDGEGADFDICPTCGGRDFEGHKVDCNYASTLNNLGVPMVIWRGKEI